MFLHQSGHFPIGFVCVAQCRIACRHNRVRSAGLSENDRRQARRVLAAVADLSLYRTESLTTGVRAEPIRCSWERPSGILILGFQMEESCSWDIGNGDCLCAHPSGVQKVGTFRACPSVSVQGGHCGICDSTCAVRREFEIRHLQLESCVCEEAL